MLLEDATSKEQVAAALAAGDDELREDIEEKITESAQGIRRKIERGAMGEYDEFVLADRVEHDEDFLDSLIRESNPDLSEVPREKVAEDILYWAKEWDRTEPRTYSRRGSRGIFRAGDDCRRHEGFSYSFSRSISYYIGEDDLFVNCEFVPLEMAEGFYEEISRRFDVSWEQTHIITEQFGSGPAYDDAEVCISEDDFKEFCNDTLREYHRELVKKDPAKAIQIFLDGIKNFSSDNVSQERLFEIRKSLVEQPISDDEMKEFATQWINGDDSEKEDIVTELDEHYLLLKETGEPNEVVAEFSPEEIAEMGITKGPMKELAPWKLVKLRPSAFRSEGRMMGHCVGDKGMGYIKQASEGEIEIWSLRDSADKPRFTLEIDESFYRSEDPAEKADAILQVKGKANRTPGLERARMIPSGSGDIKFPEEVIFWKQVFSDIGVDPSAVSDFPAVRVTKNRRGRSVERVYRSFDLPHIPLRKNR